MSNPPYKGELLMRYLYIGIFPVRFLFCSSCDRIMTEFCKK